MFRLTNKKINYNSTHSLDNSVEHLQKKKEKFNFKNDIF